MMCVAGVAKINFAQRMLTCSTKSTSVPGNEVGEYDGPHTCLPSSTLSHQQNLNNIYHYYYNYYHYYYSSSSPSAATRTVVSCSFSPINEDNDCSWICPGT